MIARMADELEAPDIALYLPKPLDPVIKRKLDYLANGLTRCAHNLYGSQAPLPPAMRPIMAGHLDYLNKALAARKSGLPFSTPLLWLFPAIPQERF